MGSVRTDQNFISVNEHVTFTKLVTLFKEH